MGILQQFIHIIIKYGKGIVNKFADFLSRIETPKITTFHTLMHLDPFTHDTYKDEYIEDEDFKKVFQQLQGQVHVEEGNNKDDYYIQMGFFATWIRSMFLKEKEATYQRI